MRRLVWLTVLAIALAVPAVGYAVVGGSSDDGTLSVRNGIGKVYMNFNGSVVGRLGGRGSITVTDPNPSDGYGFDFTGCDLEKDINTSTGASTSFCQNKDGKGVVRFRAIGGKYLIKIVGYGIFVSAVGHGFSTLNGAGDDPSIDFDGTYSVNDGPYKSLPDNNTTVPLVASNGG
jgi:hypothetical protein